MISFLIAGSVGLTAMQAGIDLPRKNFAACLHTAFDSALSQKVTVPDFGVFVQKACTAEAERLKSGLIGFDVKNGVRRTQASADAQAQVDDYLAVSSERYELKVGKPKLAAVPVR